MNRKLKRSLSILLVTCLVAMCSISNFSIQIKAAEAKISATWQRSTSSGETFNVTVANQKSCCANLAVSAEFPISNVQSGSKMITIKPAVGLTWSESTKSSSISEYVHTVDILKDATQIEGTDIVLDDATHVYKVTDNVESMRLNLSFICNPKLHMSVIKNAVTMTASYIGKDGANHSYDYTVDATIREESGTVSQIGTTAIQSTSVGQTFIPSTNVYNKFGITSEYERYYKNIKLRLRLPKDVELIEDRQKIWNITGVKDDGDTHIYTLEVNNEITSLIYVDPLFNIPNTYKLGDQVILEYVDVKLTYFDDTTETLDKKYTYTFVISNDNGIKLNGCLSGVSGSGYDRVNNITWTRPDTYDGKSVYDDAEGVLGYYTLTNTSTNQTFENKRLTMDFDSENIHVHGVKLFVPSKETVLSVKFDYKLTPDSEVLTKTVQLDETDWTPQSSTKFGSFYLYTGHEGLPESAIITKVDYVIPYIAYGTAFAYYYYYGSIVDKAALTKSPATSTFTMSDDKDPSFAITTHSITKLDNTHHEGILSYSMTNNTKTEVIDAGKTLSVSVRIYASAFAHAFTPTPVYYIRDETGLGISRLKIISTNSSAAPWKKASKNIYDAATNYNPYGITVTELDRQDDGARIYKIDTSPVATSEDPYAAAVGLFHSSWANISNTQAMQIYYYVDTDKAYFDDSADHSKSQMIYLADEGNAFTNFGTYSTKTFFVGDPHDVNQNGRTDDNNILSEKERMTYYNISNKYGVQLKTQILDPTSETYKNTLTEEQAIDVNNVDTILRSSLINTSHTNINSFTIYIPIPKKGEDWGQYLVNGQDVEVSAALAGPVSNPNRKLFSIKYGNVALPVNSSVINTTLDNFTGWSDYNKEERESYNCIRITNVDGAVIPCDVTETEDTNPQAFISNNTYTFSAPISSSGQAKSGKNYTLWKSFFTDQFKGAKTMITLKYFGSPVGITTSLTGSIKGSVWNDANANGVKDDAETDPSELAGWTVELYESYGKSYEKKVATTTTDENGNYSFTDLDFPKDYVVVITNLNDEEYVFTQDSDDYIIVAKGSTHAYNTASNIPISTDNNESYVDFGFQSVSAPAPSVVPSASNVPGGNGSGCCCCCCCCCCHNGCCNGGNNGSTHSGCSGNNNNTVALIEYMNYINNYYSSYYNNYYSELYKNLYNSTQAGKDGSVTNNIYIINPAPGVLPSGMPELASPVPQTPVPVTSETPDKAKASAEPSETPAPSKAASESSESSVPASVASVANVDDVEEVEADYSSVSFNRVYESTAKTYLSESKVEKTEVSEEGTLQSSPVSKGVYKTTSNIKSIGKCAFADSDVSTVVISKNVNTIHSKAFANAKNLKTVKFTSNKPIKFVEGVAFAKCKNLTIKVPKKAVKAYRTAYKKAIDANRIQVVGY